MRRKRRGGLRQHLDRVYSMDNALSQGVIVRLNVEAVRYVLIHQCALNNLNVSFVTLLGHSVVSLTMIEEESRKSKKAFRSCWRSHCTHSQ